MTIPTNEYSAIVVDDHPLVARGIADFLRTHCGFAHAKAITLVADTWEYIRQSGAPSLAFIDFWLPEGTALATLTRLRNEYPATRLIVISGDSDPAVLDKVRRLSVDGFLLKQTSPNVFAQAVATVLRGEGWFDDGPVVTESVIEARNLPLTPAELGLTPRQGEVLALILKGMPNKRVAQTLSLTEQTVKDHVSGILERLGARNRIELITKLQGKRVSA